MDILFFSTALSDDIYNEVSTNCKKFKPTFSGVGFDRNVAVGLSRDALVKGVSFYPIPGWPKYNYVIEKSRDYVIENFHCHIPQMIDLPIVKEISYSIGIRRYLKNTDGLVDGETVVVVCGLYRSLLRPAVALKKKYGIKIIAIVPDVPELMATYRKDYSKLRKTLNRFDMLWSKVYRSYVDGFVVLSEHMNPVVNSLDKPYIVVDGLTNVSLFPNGVDKVEKKFILYAGKVSRTFGVDKLVESFMNASINEDIMLVICGDGDYSDALKQIVKKNSRIQYLGLVPHERILELECQAELLVEPRPTDNEIVKMSFPSKIIEYMASGTPVLSTNLPCYSAEYALYQYRINDESISGMKAAIESTLAISKKDRQKKGSDARNFVFENKTMQKQCEKIISFIKGM